MLTLEIQSTARTRCGGTRTSWWSDSPSVWSFVEGKNVASQYFVIHEMYYSGARWGELHQSLRIVYGIQAVFRHQETDVGIIRTSRQIFMIFSSLLYLQRGARGCTKELFVPGQQTFACGLLWTDPAYNAWIGGRSLTTFYHKILERKYQLPMDGGHCALRLRCCYERSWHSLTRAVTLSERIHRYTS